jgi:pyruvate formate lyase activating enzyme
MSEAPDAVCDVCPRHCRLADGATGFCRARKAAGGHVVPANYGQITSIALDPIEKKPLAFFHPGENVLSVGSYGCNMRCPFCQNDSISQHGQDELHCRTATPQELADLALRLKDGQRNIGLAYTYNEPLVGWEFVHDCAKEIKACGLCNVLVSNGCATENVIAGIAPLIDAANIDIKGPSQDYYDWLGGDFNAVCRTIRVLHDAGCHVEATTLIVPGRNDSDADMESIAGFIASVSPDIPLHVTRFFPRWRMSDARPTPISTILRLADIAKRRLNHVLTGNC